MNQELLAFLYEIEPRIIDVAMIEFAFIKWSKTSDFKKMVDSVVSDRADRLLDSGDYEKQFDPNPLGVESHLVGNSGEWEFTDAALDAARNDAKAELVEENSEFISQDFEQYIATEFKIDINNCEQSEYLRQLIYTAIQRC